ncbi:MAG TPA: P-loop NTPase [Bacillota bacterium]
MSAVAGEHQAAALQRLLGARRGDGRFAAGLDDTRVLVVASGKGGVGKTNLAVNLAVALQQRGHRVLVLDADLGLGNVETLCGLHCASHLADFLAGRGELADILEVGPAGILCAAGGSALQEPWALGRRELRRLLRALLGMDRQPTHLVIDLPAGLGDSVRSCLAAAGDILLVTTPEPTALADAYALAKATCRPNPTARLHLVVNQAATAVEARLTFERLRSAMARFLGAHLAYGGTVPSDPAVKRAVREQVPFVITSPLAPASRAVRALAVRLERRRAMGQAATAFFARLSAAGEEETHHAAGSSPAG